MANVVLKNVNKIYDNGFHAVHNFSFEIKDKEFIVFVGPSGCGKSTTLRMIAGLEEISDGELYINDILYNNIAPQDRDMAMVFQNYALYPHMTVFNNMAFGLKNHRNKEVKLDKSGNTVMSIDKSLIKLLKKDRASFVKSLKEAKNEKELEELEAEIALIDKKIEQTQTTPVPEYVYKKIPAEEIEHRVLEAAKILDIERYLNQKPKSLSGGQCQRVALGRAIVRNPVLFLMDEPLSNLDAKLRVSMRSEIVALHEKIGATTIYVTHDQTEAMTMATRIIIMNKGFIQQIGTPKDIYQHPANLFVATFIGSPAMNILPVTYETKTKTIKFFDYKIALNDKKAKLIEESFKEEIKNMKEHYEKVKNNVVSYYEGLNANIKKEESKFDVSEETSKDEVLAKEADLIAKFEDQLNKGVLELTLGIRPEDVLSDEKGAINVDTGVVELLGAQLIAHCKYKDVDIVSTLSANSNIKPHTKVKMSFLEENIHLFFNNEDQKAIF